MKPSDLKTADDALAEDLQDPEFRREWERTALARAVSERLVRYRIEHRLTQTALARKLGMQQSAVARLEAAEHNPSIDMLSRLSRGLGINFNIVVRPETVSFDLTA
jgi:ribosome-binding protein aMBF1 (putative translation factor)